VLRNFQGKLYAYYEPRFEEVEGRTVGVAPPASGPIEVDAQASLDASALEHLLRGPAAPAKVAANGAAPSNGSRKGSRRVKHEQLIVGKSTWVHRGGNGKANASAPPAKKSASNRAKPR
jgi:hypothetical protein